MELDQPIKEPVTLPDGPVYAIGDIHGEFNLLAELMAKIEVHALELEMPDGARPRVIFLGDYVDRGPKSYEVLEYLNALLTMTDAPLDCRFLMGNHEHLMLRGGAAGDENWFDMWIARVSLTRSNGGLNTLESFRRGLNCSTPSTPKGAQQMTRLVMRKCKELFMALECAFVTNGCLFVHAGIDVTRTLADQRLHDVMWVRDSWIGNEANNKTGLRVVHGHTPMARPQVNEFAINVDTGAFKTGTLTAAFISGPGEEPEFIQAGRKS